MTTTFRQGNLFDGWAARTHARSSDVHGPDEQWRYCVECGHVFTLSIHSPGTALACSPRCNNRRWRAASMLAGTHGWVDGQFKRLVIESKQ